MVQKCLAVSQTSGNNVALKSMVSVHMDDVEILFPLPETLMSKISTV